LDQTCPISFWDPAQCSSCPPHAFLGTHSSSCPPSDGPPVCMSSPLWTSTLTWF
jgi:hypothetical protein